jgi:Ca2+/Na+ antiporter
MSHELLIVGATVVWWSFAVVVFASLTGNQEGSMTQRITGAAFWPVIVVLYLPVLLWRIPFKTAKTIRTDLRNRKLLREFNEWLERRDQEERA